MAERVVDLSIVSVVDVHLQVDERSILSTLEVPLLFHLSPMEDARPVLTHHLLLASLTNVSACSVRLSGPLEGRRCLR